MKLRRRKKLLRYRKERALLSDVLPYELPLTFSNRRFYRFLVDNRIEFSDDKVFWKQSDSLLDATVRLIVGANATNQIATQVTIANGQRIPINSMRLADSYFVTIPFAYKIKHKDEDFRELAICHPRNQLQLVDFYHVHKEQILHHCNVGDFSIRRPHRVAKYVFHKDKTHRLTISEETVGVEEHDREYEHLRSFFVYKDYSHIFKFYESPKFHACEKRYQKLIRVDISKCFESIYTHSIQWAVLGKAGVKFRMGPAKETFPGKFDRFMQRLNYNETNGIIIGPEFSRIFAELLLQAIDSSIAKRVRPALHQKDYEIFRYVDDYFIFYNDEKHKDDILRELKLELKTL